MPSSRYTVLIPVYNEEGNIAPLLSRLRAAIGPEPEIIVIDDGSRDNTAQQVDTTVCRLMQHSVNQGKGVALRTGIQEATGRVIVFIDGDGQDDPKELEKIVAAVENGADVAIGSRFLPNDSPNNSEVSRYSNEAVKPVNEFGNKIVTGMINIFFGGHVTDACASLRGYKAHVLKAMSLTSNRYEIETEMMIRCLRSRLKIVEVPVHRYARQHGISNLFDVPFGRTRFAFRILKTMARGYFVWR